MMDITHLRTFVAVARDGGITRASDSLHLSQPAVSAHIKAMEETLGLALFDRTPRGMRLTGEGGCLLGKAEDILAAHRSLLEEATRLRKRMAGTLRLGVGGIASTRALGRLLSAMAELHPEVTVDLRHAPSAEIRATLLDGGLDAGFFNESAEPDPALSVIDVSEFGIVLAAPPGWVPVPSTLDWKVLEALPWIVPGPNTHCGLAAETLFREKRLRPRRTLPIEGEAITRTLIAGGVGLGFLHDRTAREAEAAGEVVVLRALEERVRVLFATRRTQDDTPLVAMARTLVGRAEGHAPDQDSA
jgi:DNA-binding transcriptional LysR family regulator